jgi:DNA polymerase III alpha subunit (gram-positive type)
MYIFVDVETNGVGTFRPPTQTITQLSFIKTDENRNIIKTYSKLIKGATELADIPQVVFTLEQLNNEGVELKDALIEFQTAVEDCPRFIAHNAEFDFSIIKNNAQKLNIQLNLDKYFCTMRSSTDYCMIKSDYSYSPYKWPKLSELAEKLQIDYIPDKLHNSEEDVCILIRCFFKGIDIGIFK